MVMGNPPVAAGSAEGDLPHTTSPDAQVPPPRPHSPFGVQYL
jgi:hypothetical protein